MPDENALLERLVRVETKLDVVISGHSEEIKALRDDVKDLRIEADKNKRFRNILVGVAAGGTLVGGGGAWLSISTLLGG